jgi:hypothetical protein
MTYPNGDWLADLDPTDEERLALLEALDEVEAEEAAGLPSGGDDDDEPPEAGPWDDELGQLQAIGGQLDDSYARAAAVAAGDDEDREFYARRPLAEDKLSHALGRVADESYTPPAAFRPARDIGGRYAVACGPLDDLGQCGARYHAADCGTVTAGAAATGDATEAEEWNATLTSQPSALDVATAAQQLGLANEPQPGYGTDLWGDLLEPPGGPDPGLHARVLAYMGEIDPEPEPREPGPDVSAIRAALGL